MPGGGERKSWRPPRPPPPPRRWKPPPPPPRLRNRSRDMSVIKGRSRQKRRRRSGNVEATLLRTLEAAPKQPPRAETQTFFCHSGPRGRRLRPASQAFPISLRYCLPAAPPSFSPPWETPGAQGRAPSPAGCSAAAGPGEPASSPRVEAKFGRPQPARAELPAAPPASRRA